MRTGGNVRHAGEDTENHSNHDAEKQGHVAELPDQGLQRMKFDETRVLLHAKNNQRSNKAGEHLKQVRKKCHGALMCRNPQ